MLPALLLPLLLLLLLPPLLLLLLLLLLLPPCFFRFAPHKKNKVKVKGSSSRAGKGKKQGKAEALRPGSGQIAGLIQIRDVLLVPLMILSHDLGRTN